MRLLPLKHSQPNVIFLIKFHPMHFSLAGCHSTELLLSCPPDQLLIVHSASFHHHSSTLNCSKHTRHSASSRLEEIHIRSPARDIRRHVTRRCSGYSRGEDCKFSLLLDVDDGEVLGPGLVNIVHTCVRSGDLVTQCNSRNQVRLEIILEINQNIF